MAEVHIVDIDGEQWDIKDAPLTVQFQAFKQSVTTRVASAMGQCPFTTWVNRLTKINKVVHLDLFVRHQEQITVKDNDVIGVIPEGFRPTEQTPIMCRWFFDSVERPLTIWINTDGTLQILDLGTYTVNNIAGDLHITYIQN